MNETLVHIGTQPGAVRLVVTQVTGAQGVGLARLMFNIEITTKHSLAKGCPLLFNARLEVLGLGGPDRAMPFAALKLLDRVPVVQDVGAHDAITLVADIDDRQLQIMEEHRDGAQRFRLWLPGMTFREGRHEPFYATNVDYTVSQSDWIAILEQVGYTRRFLVELELPNPQSNPKLAEAIGYFGEARRRYMQGEWRHCVESLRQCVAAIVGKKPDDEDELSDVQAALKEARNSKASERIGYERRGELIHQTLKFSEETVELEIVDHQPA